MFGITPLRKLKIGGNTKISARNVEEASQSGPAAARIRSCFGELGRRVHQLLDHVDDFLDGAIVRRQMLLQFFDPGGEFLVRGQHLAHANKGAHHENAHFYRLFGVEHRRRHDCAMFGEGVWQRATATAASV